MVQTSLCRSPQVTRDETSLWDVTPQVHTSTEKSPVYSREGNVRPVCCTGKELTHSTSYEGLSFCALCFETVRVKNQQRHTQQDGFCVAPCGWYQFGLDAL